jgi:hypothetical protein
VAERGDFGDDGGAFHQRVGQRGFLDLFEIIDGEVERVGLAVVGGVGGVEAQHGGASTDGARGVGRSEAVLFRIDFVTADAGRHFDRRGEEVGDGLDGRLGRALGEFLQHRTGGDFG